MRQFLLTLLFGLFICVVAFAQSYSYNICDSSSYRTAIPQDYNDVQNLPLHPAPCSAKSNYGTTLVTVLLPQQRYIETRYKIKLKTETIIDGCTETVTVTGRDTFDRVSQIIEPQKQYAKTHWVVRLELLTYLPHSRPSGCFAIQLPEGNLKGYYVTYYGEYPTKEDAKIAVSRFKQKYPNQFCDAFVWKLPENIEVQYKYVQAFTQYSSN